MKRKRVWVTCLLAVAVGLALDAHATGQAQNPAASTPAASTSANAVFSKEEIAQLVAPVALYPDSLLA